MCIYSCPSKEIGKKQALESLRIYLHSHHITWRLNAGGLKVRPGLTRWLTEWLKVFASKLDSLSLFSRTHMMGRKNSHESSSDVRAHTLNKWMQENLKMSLLTSNKAQNFGVTSASYINTVTSTVLCISYFLERWKKLTKKEFRLALLGRWAVCSKCSSYQCLFIIVQGRYRVEPHSTLSHHTTCPVNSWHTNFNLEP